MKNGSTRKYVSRKFVFKRKSFHDGIHQSFRRERKGMNAFKRHEQRLFSIMAGIVFLIFLTACNEDSQSADEVVERVTPVETAEVIEEELVIVKDIYARTSPNETTPITLQLPGEIDVLDVEEGEDVEEDDRILVLQTQAGKQNINAPKDGKVLHLIGAEGDVVSNEQPIAIVADLTTLKLDFSVTGDMRDHFQKGDKVDTYYEDETYEATISTVGYLPDETGLYPVEATIHNKDEKILPGKVLQLKVPVQRVTKSVIVPTTAIVEEGGESFIYVVQEEKVAKKSVTIIETQTEQTAIDGDVKAGDQIVVSGQLTLSDNSKVNVVKESGE